MELELESVLAMELELESAQVLEPELVFRIQGCRWFRRVG